MTGEREVTMITPRNNRIATSLDRRQALRLGVGGALAAVPLVTLPLGSASVTSVAAAQEETLFRVDFRGIYCYAETDSDQLSDSDEYYLLVNLSWTTQNDPGSWSTQTLKVPSSGYFEDMDGSEPYEFRQNVMWVPASLEHLVLTAQLLEHDYGDPNYYADEIQAAAALTAAGLASTGVGLPAAAVSAGIAAASGIISDSLDTGDDLIGLPQSIEFSLADMDYIAQQDWNPDPMPWDDFTEHQGDGALVQAYYTIEYY
jgi:hypothetical protein